MPSSKILTPFRRDALFTVVVLLLLLSPVWVSISNISSATYMYERAEVVVNEEDGITYAGGPEVDDTRISKDIGCSVPEDTRTCAFERHLLSNATIPTGMYTNNPAVPFDVGIKRYQYVQINSAVYHTAYVGNRSVRGDDGLYRMDLALEPASATDALRQVSIAVSTESEDVPPVVVEAARQGTATADRDVEIPQTPLRVDNDTYYRVYAAGQNDPTTIGSFLGTALSFAGPLAGLYIGYQLSRRIEIRYVGETSS